MTEKLDGYTLTTKMRKLRRRHPLTSTEQALYHELVAICNEEGWPVAFSCSCDELCSSLRISENTLNKARVALINAGLLVYKSGKSKRQFSTYSLSTTSNFDTNRGTDRGTNRGANAATNRGGDSGETLRTIINIKENLKENIYVVIGDREYFFDDIKNLFEADAGLKMTYAQKGMPPGKFSDAVREWMAQNNGSKYHDFTKCRKHFFYWLPNYSPEKKVKDVKRGLTAEDQLQLRREHANRYSGDDSAGDEWQNPFVGSG